ncbi:hypothetical protein FGG08_001465 [Glutinoglossum americanum]|uniref:Guanine nucleotide-exchange factor SEC12 n=1 Tax=Glutinoglossum americanum TaxID=1670608 RepID=A0A9P8L094_9PEZI|nr:hypothetical protein FGG08_001465 [Glutinoglossum americanum]
MAPSLHAVKATLTYPLYAADFDPQDNNRLVVGGGGGEGRSGIGNKITVLEFTTTEISTLAELELSRDEDSVTSLAVPLSQSNPHSMRVFAGVNSSLAAKQAGMNKHFRRFTMGYTDGKAKKAMWEVNPPLSLFSPNDEDKEVYQRITRLSPVRREGSANGTETRLAAITTGLSPLGEIVFLNTTQPDIVRGRINLGKFKEAADIDIIESGSREFRVVYCTDHEVYLCTASTKTTPKRRTKPIVPRQVYERLSLVPGKGRPIFRALRFLMPSLVLILSNIPGRSGAELLVLRIEDQDVGRVVLQKRLHNSMKAGAGLDVAILEEGGKDESDGDKQFVIAVAGQDISLEILTLNYSAKGGLGKFSTFSVIRNVHPHQMTKICFSHFIPPLPVPPGSSNVGNNLPKTLKLASVSMGNTVVIHTLQLLPVPLKSRSPRYVLKRPGRSGTAQRLVTILLLLTAALVAIAIQALLEIRGHSTPILGAADRLPHGFHTPLAAKLYVAETDTDNSVQTKKISGIRHLKNLLHRQDEGEQGQPPKTIVIREDDVTEAKVRADVHADEEAVEGAKRWEDLEEHQREGWKSKLAEAGQWAVEEGEAILKGVFFAELGGAIGGAVGA